MLFPKRTLIYCLIPLACVLITVGVDRPVAGQSAEQLTMYGESASLSTYAGRSSIVVSNEDDHSHSSKGAPSTRRSPVIAASHDTSQVIHSKSDTTHIGYPQFWISGGFAAAGNTNGLIFSASYAHSDHYILTGHYITMQFAGARPLDAPSSSTRSISDLEEWALMYGLTQEYGFSQLSIAGGPAVARIEEYRRLGYGPDPTSYQLGLSMEVRAALTMPLMGVGIKGFAHLSRQKFAGIGLYFQMGKLR